MCVEGDDSDDDDQCLQNIDGRDSSPPAAGLVLNAGEEGVKDSGSERDRT